MKKVLFPGLLNVLFLVASAQNNDSSIPQRVLDEFASRTQGSGIWITDNSNYMSENEPYDEYGLKWEYGLGKSSVKGKLFVLKEGKDLGTVWEFRIFWDPEQKKTVIQQFGSDGTYGVGELTFDSPNSSKTDQRFSNPAGVSYRTGHKSDYSDPKATISKSYAIAEEGEWKLNREYIWKLKE